MIYSFDYQEAVKLLESNPLYSFVLSAICISLLALVLLALTSFIELVTKQLKRPRIVMKIEHTRTNGFRNSPAGTSWWTVSHNNQQYVVKQDVSASGHPHAYQLVPDYNPTAVPIKVRLQGNSAIVDAANANFIDITLAVSLAMFIKEETSKSS